MEWIAGIARFLLQLIQSIVVWPMAAVVIAWWFRRELRALIDQARERLGKVRKAKYGSAELEIPPDQPASVIEPSRKGYELTAPGSVSTIADPSREENLLRTLHYERLFNSIYGSQWELLRNLHEHGDAGMLLTDVRKFVDQWMETRKIEGTEFQKWSHFLLNNRLMEIVQRPEGVFVRITPTGRNFFDYIHVQYVPEPIRPF